MSQRFRQGNAYQPNFNGGRQGYPNQQPPVHNNARQAAANAVDTGPVEIPDLFINNYVDGHGFYKYSDGTEYDGEYKDFQRHGKGLYIYTSGTLYDGEFKFGKKDGWGVYKYADGTIYEVSQLSIK